MLSNLENLLLFLTSSSFSGAVLLFVVAPQFMKTLHLVFHILSMILGDICFKYPRLSLLFFYVLPLLVLNLCWGNSPSPSPVLPDLNPLTQIESVVKETPVHSDLTECTVTSVNKGVTQNNSILSYTGIAIACIIMLGLVIYLGSSDSTPPGGGQTTGSVSQSSSAVLDAGSSSSLVNPVVCPINSPVLSPDSGVVDSLMLQHSLAEYASAAGIGFYAGTLFSTEFIANSVAPLLATELQNEPERALIHFEGDPSMFYEEVGLIYPNFFSSAGQENAFFHLVHTILYGLNHLLEHEQLQGRDLYYHLTHMFVRDPVFLPTLQQIETIIRYIPWNSVEYPLEVDNVLLLPLLLAFYEALLLLLTNPSIIQQVTVGLNIDDLSEVHFESDEEETL